MDYAELFAEHLLGTLPMHVIEDELHAEPIGEFASFEQVASE